MTRLRYLIRRAWWKLRHPRTPYRVTITARDFGIQQLYARRAETSLDALDPEIMRAMGERITLMQDRAILGQPPRRPGPHKRYPWEPTTERPCWVDPLTPEQPVWARLGGFSMGYGPHDATNPFLFSAVVPGDAPKPVPDAPVADAKAVFEAFTASLPTVSETISGIYNPHSGSPAIPHSVMPAVPEVNNYDPPCPGPSFTDCSVASDSAGAVGGME